MKTKLFLLVVLFVLAVSVNAQTKDAKPFRIGLGTMAGLSMGDMAKQTSLAYGLDLMGEYAIASSFAFTLSVGYVDFHKKSGVTGNMGLIPVLAGVKYYFTDKLYGSCQAGPTSSTQEDFTGSRFTLVPGIGYKIDEKIDILFKYQSASRDGVSLSSFVGLRAGLRF
jgi:hypothetical protein